ncbi:hypothetical protein CAURIC_07320 [Corynebacterium auriscanis]|nr:hypothetical protein CAURIC_07320 [Corynebacterium auriscanis]
MWPHSANGRSFPIREKQNEKTKNHDSVGISFC